MGVDEGNLQVIDVELIGSRHGDNPLLRPKRIQIATKSKIQPLVDEL